ncbi:MAG: cysteine-rich repeat protein [Bradymonadia bacterium]|jgi:cysteine-rich repeat protein
MKMTLTQACLLRLLLLCSVAVFAACGDSEPDPTCGDGAVEGDETCDDGNAFPGDGCSLTCTSEAGWTCSELGGQIICATMCGDDVVAGDEACDDGNTVSGDGCSAICATETAAIELCDDGVDNDGDGNADCDDTDCAAEPACETLTDEDCGDGVDNDGDGNTDCADADCDADAGCAPEIEVCDDGVDNDDDGLVDCEDDDCADNDVLCPPSVEVCDDGIDNDGDGRTDCDDPDCVQFCPAGECGDGELNAGESCDDGDTNSDTDADACRLDCQIAGCGDSVLDTDEECDGGERCRANCTTDRCLGELAVQDFNAGAVTSGDGLRFQFSLNATALDDRVPTCIDREGFDVAVEFVPPSSGIWLINANGRGTNIPVTVSVGTSCAPEDELACSATDGVGDRGAVLVSLEAGTTYVFSMDSARTSQGIVVIEAQPVGAIATLGDACISGEFDVYCEISTLCLDATCTLPEADLAGLGEACGDPLDGLLSCDTSLECLGNICEAIAGTGCLNPADLQIRLTPVDGGGGAWSTSVLAAPAPDLLCGDVPSGIYLTYQPAAAAWIEFSASSSTVDADIVIALGETCGETFGELGCAQAVTGLGATLETPAAPGEPILLFIGANGPLDLMVREIPIAGEAELCDVDGESSRCGPGLFCNGIGACEFAGTGSCGSPNVLGPDSGDVFGDRGILVGFDTTDSVNTSTGSCGPGGLTDAVFEFSAPGPGAYRFRASAGADSAVIYTRRSCERSATELECSVSVDGGAEVSSVLREGERVFVFVEVAEGTGSGSLAVTGRSLGDRGTGCLFDSNCLPDLVCDAAALVCTPSELAEGDECGPPLESECALGLTCLDRECVAQAELGETCAPGVAESCVADLLCAIIPLDGGRCLNPVAAEGDPCDNAVVTCPSNTDCVGYSVGGLGECARAGSIGQPCYSSETTRQCVPGFVCIPAVDGPGDVCSPPDETIAIGDSCEENPRCELGAVCSPLAPDLTPLPGATCRARLAPGDACTDNPAEGACDFGYFCAELPDASRRCVQVGSCFANSDCVDGEWCSVGLCEPRSAEGDACTLGLSAIQCLQDLECRDDEFDGIACWTPEDSGCSFSFDCEAGDYCDGSGMCATQLPLDTVCDPTERGDQCAPPALCRDNEAGGFQCIP